MDIEKEIQAEYSPEIFCPKCGYLMEGNGMAQSITLKYFISLGFVKCTNRDCPLFGIKYRMELPTVKLVKVE